MCINSNKWSVNGIITDKLLSVKFYSSQTFLLYYVIIHICVDIFIIFLNFGVDLKVGSLTQECSFGIWSKKSICITG